MNIECSQWVTAIILWAVNYYAMTHSLVSVKRCFRFYFLLLSNYWFKCLLNFVILDCTKFANELWCSEIKNCQTAMFVMLSQHSIFLTYDCCAIQVLSLRDGRAWRSCTTCLWKRQLPESSPSYAPHKKTQLAMLFKSSTRWYFFQTIFPISLFLRWILQIDKIWLVVISSQIVFSLNSKERWWLIQNWKRKRLPQPSSVKSGNNGNTIKTLILVVKDN